MTQVSSLFLSDISVVDHAYIDDNGNIVGGSFNPSFLVTGEIDPVEQVVVDFSSVKKQIKETIDAREGGFDHKLWFIKGYSNGSIRISQIENVEYVTIDTPTTKLIVPQNAVTVIDDPKVPDYTVNSIGFALQNHVEKYLRTLHPHSNIRVVCINNQNRHYPTKNTESALFRYTHGLKDSTSWGCQNIAHGHLSYIQALDVNNDCSNEAKLVLDNIASTLDNTVFVMADNIKSSIVGPRLDSLSLVPKEIQVSYKTDRGMFLAVYKTDAYKITILETETTIEHIVEWVAATYGDILKQHGCTGLFVSEGLSKGAFVLL